MNNNMNSTLITIINKIEEIDIQLYIGVGNLYNNYYNYMLNFQVRDEYRTDYDGGRGGYGKIIAQKITPNTLER